MAETRYCIHRYSDGSNCRRWASRGQKYCHKHNPERTDYEASRKYIHELPAEVRLATVDDVLHVIRQAINGVRLGYMSPSQAYAIGHLSYLWLKLAKESDLDHGRRGLRESMVSVLMEDIDDPKDEAADMAENEKIKQEQAAQEKLEEALREAKRK
jgi:hypothetical protein